VLFRRGASRLGLGRGLAVLTVGVGRGLSCCRLDSKNAGLAQVPVVFLVLSWNLLRLRGDKGVKFQQFLFEAAIFEFSW
jgi:hypothetical protein